MTLGFSFAGVLFLLLRIDAIQCLCPEDMTTLAHGSCHQRSHASIGNRRRAPRPRLAHNRRKAKPSIYTKHNLHLAIPD